MITLFHSPMACSLASKLALWESGLPHEVKLVRIHLGEQLSPEYLAVNPTGKVPTLLIDGVVVTESTAILALIADFAPDANLLPADPLPRAQAQAVLSFLSSSVHAAFTTAMFPERFAGGGDAEAVRLAAVERLNHALDLLETRMNDRDHLLDRFSLCDLYLLVFLCWRAHPALQGKLSARPLLDGLQQRLMARPRVGAALAEDMAERQRA